MFHSIMRPAAAQSGAKIDTGFADSLKNPEPYIQAMNSLELVTLFSISHVIHGYESIPAKRC